MYVCDNVCMKAKRQGRPNSYREKQCPQCQATHKRRGIYCSRGCAWKNRPKCSTETKAKIATSNLEHHANLPSPQKKYRPHTDANEAAVYTMVESTRKSRSRQFSPEEFVDDEHSVLPESDNLSSNQFISSGDLWTTDD